MKHEQFTYVKPKDVRYVDMAIYIDDNIYDNPSPDIELIYQYLYHLSVMLAKHNHFFKVHKYYDSFGLYMASRVYMRLTNPKQYEFTEDGEPKMGKLRSVLNYMHTILYPCKVDFEQCEYYQCVSQVLDSYDVHYSFNNLLYNINNEENHREFEFYLSSAQDIAENFFVRNVPYLPKTSRYNNICISVLLTFIDSITLRNRDIERIKHLESTGRLQEHHIIDFFDEQEITTAILFHVPESENNLIVTLTRRLKDLIRKELDEILTDNIVFNNMILNDQIQNVIGVMNEH